MWNNSTVQQHTQEIRKEHFYNVSLLVAIISVNIHAVIVTAATACRSMPTVADLQKEKLVYSVELKWGPLYCLLRARKRINPVLGRKYNRSTGALFLSADDLA